MEVYALIGGSGTGKSHRAMIVATEKGIDAVIDDGLLIKGGKKLAGKSAKRELTAIKAVKTAIFMDPEHAQMVKEKIAEVQPRKILILGTSQRMINRIAATLELPLPEHLIFIEDIATELEIIKAKKMREDFGKHVIPVPTIEIKKDFPNYLIDPMSFFFKKKGKKRIGEKSIVRPRFNMIGKLVISEHVIEQLVKAAGESALNLEQVLKVTVVINEEGVTIITNIKIRYPGVFKKTAIEFQKATIDLVESLTGLNVIKVDVKVKAVHITNQ